jgi:hypothetical protein
MFNVETGNKLVHRFLPPGPGATRTRTFEIRHTDYCALERKRTSPMRKERKALTITRPGVFNLLSLSLGEGGENSQESHERSAGPGTAL